MTGATPEPPHPPNSNSTRAAERLILHLKNCESTTKSGLIPTTLRSKSLAAVADWRGCQLARWQAGPLKQKTIWAPRKCGREKRTLSL
ncbi:hypothetical protein AVEN_253448-1, partial [Araneus ventricosus]